MDHRLKDALPLLIVGVALILCQIWLLLPTLWR